MNNSSSDLSYSANSEELKWLYLVINLFLNSFTATASPHFLIFLCVTHDLVRASLMQRLTVFYSLAQEIKSNLK